MMNHLGLGALFVVALLTVGGLGDPRQQQHLDALTSLELVDQSEWEAYKLEWGKHYDGPAAEAEARANYGRNKRFVEQFNRGRNATGHTFSLKLNRFSDMANQFEQNKRSPIKFKQGKRSGWQGLNPEAKRALIEGMLRKANLRDLPTEVDWRKDPSRVSSVKDQGDCEAGWAFAIAGLLEGQEKVHANKSLEKVIDLSAQNLLDCDNNIGCHLGEMHSALRGLKRRGGIPAETYDPYVGEEGRKCKFEKSESVINIKTPNRLPSMDEDILQTTLATYGPVAARIDSKAPTLIQYEKGVYNDKSCGHYDPLGYHAVLIVGYGTDPKDGDYWIVKNSWGPKWGEQGYVRIARNENFICLLTFWPIIADF